MCVCATFCTTYLYAIFCRRLKLPALRVGCPQEKAVGSSSQVLVG